jgi:thioredoxin-like negative regulator of GroEL
MSADQAWEALKNGDRAQAERLFISALESDNRDLHALLGLARVRILQKRLDDAQKVALAASALDNNVLVQILEAELLGARGNSP